MPPDRTEREQALRQIAKRSARLQVGLSHQQVLTSLRADRADVLEQTVDLDVLLEALADSSNEAVADFAWQAAADWLPLHAGIRPTPPTRPAAGASAAPADHHEEHADG